MEPLRDAHGSEGHEASPVDAVNLWSSLGDAADPELRSLVEAGATLTLNAESIGSACAAGCSAHLQKWRDWFVSAFKGADIVPHSNDAPSCVVAQVPLAMIRVPEAMPAYLKLVGDKTRNVLRKAERSGYVARPFATADYLDDIFAINTSKEERSGIKMTASYLEYPSSMDARLGTYCDRHRVDNFGCFLGEKLIAYCNLQTIGELAIINRILGHADHLKFGVMPLLIKSVLDWAIARFPSVRAVNYLTLRSSTVELDRFKKGVGFRPYAVALGEWHHDKGLQFARPEAATRAVSATILESSRQGDDASTLAPEISLRGSIMFDLVPSAEDHRDSGFRAIIKGLKLPPKPRILDVGAGGFAGETTTVHLLELAGGEIDAVEINAERASALQKKFGKAINVINRGFGEFVAEAHYDLIVFDLDSNMTATQYTKFLAPASKMLRPGGKVISNIFYDSALAFDANSKLLNPSNRTAYEIFMREYFGVLKLEREVAAGRLRREGFATLGLVDKWMGTGRANAIGWLVLEKIA